MAYKDLTGQRFTKLLVIKRGEDIVYNGHKHKAWECLCICGKTTFARTNHLTTGRKKSCGCHSSSGDKKGKHKMCKTREYKIWDGMKCRCFQPSHQSYHRYGGRGITICDRWLEFNNFYQDMGPAPTPTHTIDRIDNNGNYEPSNCRWATVEEQSYNKETTIRITFNGNNYTISELSKLYGVPSSRLAGRLRNGWTIERALTTPKLK